MMRTEVVVTAALVLVGAIAASAQHPQSHPQGRHHGTAGHEQMDPAVHAALHALMQGDWQGTVRSSAGATKVGLKVAVDKAGKLDFLMTGDEAARLGAAGAFAIDGPSIRWTQEVAGKPCQVTAKVAAATTNGPQTLAGKVACADGESTLLLSRTN
jgi:hypothetical protein